MGNRLILHGDNFPLLPLNSVTTIIGFMEDGIVPMNGIVTMSTIKAA